MRMTVSTRKTKKSSDAYKIIIINFNLNMSLKALKVNIILPE